MSTERKTGAGLAAASGSARVGNCPLEQRIAAALEEAGIRYLTDFEGKSPANLDFYLPDWDLYIEVKGGHSPRIARQMKRSKNIIVAQGAKAVELLATLIEQNA